MADDDEVSKKPAKKSTTGWMICNNSFIWGVDIQK